MNHIIAILRNIVHDRNYYAHAEENFVRRTTPLYTAIVISIVVICCCIIVCGFASIYGHKWAIPNPPNKWGIY